MLDILISYIILSVKRWE